MDQHSADIQRQPWGRAFGLIVSCVVVLVSIARSISPAEIMVRSIAAGILTAIIVRGFIWLLVLTSSQES